MTDQTRADFEAHFQLTTRQKWQHPDGSYKFPEIQAKWEGYQAGVAKAAHDVFPLGSGRQQISAPVAAAAPGAVPSLTVAALLNSLEVSGIGAQTLGSKPYTLGSISLEDIVAAVNDALDVAAPVAAAALVAEQKPVRYELRMCAEGQCDDWKPVSKERYDTLTANGGDTGDGLKFEGRALYAAPVAAAAPGADDEKDAARYRWWRDVYLSDDAFMPDAVIMVDKPDELDAAIDSIIAGK